MSKERNFRTLYYEKVGFRAVEEKKSIEILLNEDPVKKEKLMQFCLRFGVMSTYRSYVWKMLLGILPIYQRSREFVQKHREEQYKDLDHAFGILFPNQINSSIEQKMLRMKLIEKGELPLQEKFLDANPENQYFTGIARAASGFLSDVDLFWISTRFHQYIIVNVYPSLPQFPELTAQCLKKEDNDLYIHLNKHQVLSTLPFLEWFHVCFSNVLPEAALERVWDRIIGGSSSILVYVAVSIMVVLRRPLLTMQTRQKMLDYLKWVPEDCGDRIVTEALELLIKNGDQHSFKPDSPSSGEGGHSGPVRKSPNIKSRPGSMEGSTVSLDKSGKALAEVKVIK